MGERSGDPGVGENLLFIPVYAIGHFYFEIWNPSIFLAEFFIATAVVIIICVKILGKKL